MILHSRLIRRVPKPLAWLSLWILGLLHMEIIQERIEREFGIDIVLTAPSVTYKIKQTNGNAFDLDNPSDYPDVQTIAEIQEPYVGLSIIAPTQ